MYRVLKFRESWIPIRQLLKRSTHNATADLEFQQDKAKTVYLETYGCQMNVNDSEVVLSILKSVGYHPTKQVSNADVILLNTCAIREKPENKIWARLDQIRKLQNSSQKQRSRAIIGVLGCMAERVKEKLLDVEKLADLVVGPDAYRDLPNILQKLQNPRTDQIGAVNVALSLEETYADIIPIRPQSKVSAFLTIMRGCNNMCSFCIVPYTRGRERSRPMQSILDEVKMLRDQGIKDITLLGQNVNSYSDFSHQTTKSFTKDLQKKDEFSVYASGFTSVYKPRREGGISFAELLAAVADLDEELRIRFTSPHPKDFNDDVIDVVHSRHNICKHLHVPAQSGSSTVLTRMRRGYTRESYDNLIARIKQKIPNVALSTDIIVGFSKETDNEHQETVELMRKTKFDQAFMFKYSEREKTHAHRHWPDDVSPKIKQERLQEVIEVFREGLHHRNQAEIGKNHMVLVEEEASKEKNCLTGRSDTFKRVIFPKTPIPSSQADSNLSVPKVGDYVLAEIESATHGSLYAKPVIRTSLKQYFYDLSTVHLNRSKT